MLHLPQAKPLTNELKFPISHSIRYKYFHPKGNHVVTFQTLDTLGNFGKLQSVVQSL